MKAVIAIDSLKGSLSSIEAGQAIAEGIKKADAKAEVVIRPLADGGEGTVEALVCGMNGTLQHVKVTGPLGEPVVCEYGIIDETKTAVIEMSRAAGITLVPDTKKNPLYQQLTVWVKSFVMPLKKDAEDLLLVLAAVPQTMAASVCCRHWGMVSLTKTASRCLLVPSVSKN